ncbi:LOW QUALITY PROTEIN: hypothetical protein NC652_027788 [Populus alba x Populus x berolinensis]|nr:LOW QUALITY PROTEIN: hypothetical protein NC652_027788 [Populus alba x Populus x berolinensis]
MRRPFSNKDTEFVPTVNQAHLPPICCREELISRLKKTCTDPEPTRSSKYYLPGKLKQKHLTKLILGCTRNYQLMHIIRAAQPVD